MIRLVSVIMATFCIIMTGPVRAQSLPTVTANPPAPVETLVDMRPQLFFPLELNHIKVLPQRFEYQLIDKDRFRVGDVLMNSREIGFQLIPLNKEKSRYKIRFQWPAGFLQQGELAIKDSSGKALWIKKIDPDQVKIRESSDPSLPGLRSELATYESAEVVGDVLNQLKLVPFFRFCIHREEPLTRIYLCSKDLFIKSDSRQFRIQARDSYRPESFVEINGRPVGNTGIVFLNAPSEYIYLRTLLLSGATLELETRMKPVSFDDISVDDNGKTLRVRANGAEPENAADVKEISDAEWETHLSADHPYTYLKGEGDLPLRQEFMITGPVRKSGLKVLITSGYQDQTFSDKIVLTLQVPEGVTLSPYDRRTSLEKTSETEYQWTLTDLEKNSSNRRYVKVATPDGSFVGAIDIHRSLSLDGRLRLMLPWWAQFHLESVLTSKVSSYLSYDQQMVKSSSQPDVRLTTIGFEYHLPSGVHMQDPAYGLLADVTSFQNDIQSTFLINGGVYGEIKSPSWYRSLFPWTLVRLKMPFTSTNSDYKLQSSWDAELSLRHFFSETGYFELGYRNVKINLQPDQATDSEIKVSKSLFFFGLGALF
jgi:hypothetical protein